ncbi:hypothetical protein L0337_37905 [candidate division KSB1 bacterium]|nr:hypothetical protein [candidate division KSB1 bacterium]
MRLTLNIHLFLFTILGLTIYATEMWIVHSAYFLQNPSVISFAMTLDLVMGLPALYYIFVVRQRRIPAITLVPVLVLAIVIAGFILPATQQAPVDFIKKFIPLLELFVLGFIAIKIRTIVKHYHQAKLTEIYFTDALAASLERTLGAWPIVPILVTEFSLLYYAVAGWFKQFKSWDSSHLAFSYHRKTGYAAVLGALALVLIVETAALHILLQQWSTLAAWIFTGLSLYSLLWLIGDYHAQRLHPIVLSKTHLHLRAGLRWRATITLSDIEAVQKANPRERKAADYVSFAIFGQPRLVIDLKQPVIVTGLFGITRKVRRIGLAVDDERQFREALSMGVAETS